MKTKKMLQFPRHFIFVAFGLALFVVFNSTNTAQSQVAEKGFGNAVYQGLQENVFLKKWQILGPLPVSEKPGEPGAEALKEAFDKDPFVVLSFDKKKPLPPVSYYGKKYTWKYVESASDTIHLNRILGDSNYVSAYALAEIYTEAPARVLIGLGSDDGVTMWVNGKEVHKNYIDRGLSVDNDVFELNLEKGSNQVLIKIFNSRFDYGFCIRPIGGAALTGILQRSAENGDLDNIRTIIRYSPDINATNECGLTAWQLATIKGRTDIADFLKEQGAVTATDFPSIGNYVNGLFSKIPARAPGAAVLVSRNGEILYKGGFGLADIGFAAPVSTTTKFRIGSITKQFIAAAVLKLQEEGKISVQDKLSKFIPDFPRGEEITIHHLLTHTSGIHSFTNQPDFLNTATVRVTAGEMMDSIKGYTFDFNPGEQYQYNNSGFFILGVIIEKITGKTYGDYLEETFFVPLGMKNTGVHASNLVLENEATGYAIVNGVFEKALNWDMSRAGGAGSLYSTVEDLYLWNEAVFNGKVLSEGSLKAAFSPVTLNSGEKPMGVDYGYGWSIDKIRDLVFINHGGGLHGFLSFITRQPDENLSVVVLTNCTPFQDNTNPSEVASKIAEYMLWQKMGLQRSYTTDSSLSSADLKRFEGRYDYGNAMVLTVTVEEDKLYAQMSGQARFQVFPSGNNEFYWKVVEARIRFLESDGTITGAIHYQGGRELNVKKLPDIKYITLEPEVLNKYVGDYQYEKDVTISITAAEGKLFATAQGQNRIELFPVSEFEFAAREIDAGVVFIPEEDGSYKLKVRLGSNERIINRIKP